MKIISDVCDRIEHELREAETYIDCALMKKADYPALAEVYSKLSDERMKDQEMLHAQVVALIDDYKRAKGAPPEGMKAIYDYLHKKFIDWASKIKIKQAMYKGN